MENNTKNTFDSIVDYQKAHPERFELVKDHKKRIPYLVIAAICLSLVIFPGVIPFCPGWLVRVVFGIGLLYSAVMVWSVGEYYRNIQTGQTLKKIGSKIFRNGTDADYRDLILEAFAHRDFQYLATAPSTKERVLTLDIYEDPGMQEFFLHIMLFADEGFFGMTDVMVVSGAEFATNEQFIRSICAK